MPQRSSHIGLIDAKSGCGVTAPVYSLQENAHGGENCDTHPARKPVYSNAAGASPGQHTIPNDILLSEQRNVKYNCANIDEVWEKTLSQSPKEAACSGVRADFAEQTLGKSGML
jgi:hypothetical protein